MLACSCAHTFCSECFLQYFEQGGRSVVKCPCCRREVDLVAVSEPGWLPAEKSSANGRKLEERIAQYNARFSGAPRSWAAVAQDTPHLLSRLWRELSSGGADAARLVRQLRFWGFVLSAVLYLLSPFDVVSESLFGILGYLDDLMVLVVVGVMVAGFFRSIMVQHVGHMQFVER